MLSASIHTLITGAGARCCGLRQGMCTLPRCVKQNAHAACQDMWSVFKLAIVVCTLHMVSAKTLSLSDKEVEYICTGPPRDGHLANPEGRSFPRLEGACSRASPVWPSWQWQDHAGKGFSPRSKGHLFQYFCRHFDQQVARGGRKAGQNAVQSCPGEPACYHFHRSLVHRIFAVLSCCAMLFCAEPCCAVLYCANLYGNDIFDVAGVSLHLGMSMRRTLKQLSLQAHGTCIV